MDHKTDAYLEGSMVLAHRRTHCRWPDAGSGWYRCSARMPPRSSCSAWMALVVPRPEPGVSVMMDLLRPACAGSCSLSVDLQHSVVRVLFSPSVMLDFSPSRERVSGMEARSPYRTQVTHKDRVSRPFAHHVPMHEVLEADLVPECLGLWHESDLGIVHHTDVPHNASDQRGHC